MPQLPQNVATLTETFGLPAVLAFDQNGAGLVRARVRTPNCTGELYLQGAHVTGWQPSAPDEDSGHPVLFLSPRAEFLPGKPIRGGVPVVFPWFGARTATAASQRTDGPSHGFARIEDWTLAFAAMVGDDLHLTLTLAPTDTARALGFDSFRLAYEIIFGETLSLRLTVANDGSEPLVFEEALHTYLAVGDARAISITGLNDTEFLDKTDGFRRKRETDSVLRLTGETDRPHLNTTGEIFVADPAFERTLSTFKVGSHSTVIWNPWAELSAKTADLGEGAWQGMVCVETANVADNRITLAPGAVHVMGARVGVEGI